jgi:hypothetical protein
MPTTIDSAGITFNDATSFTSATLVADSVGTTQIANGSVIAAKLGTDEQKQIAKAWVNFDGTTSPGTIRSSYNVSSVTRNAAGQYTVSFTTPMTDANYTLTGTAQLFNPGTPSGWVTLHNLGVPATNSCQVGSGAGVSNQNAAFVNVAIFGN